MPATRNRSVTMVTTPLVHAVRAGKILVAELGYGGKLLPTFPVIDATRPSRLAWLLKEELLPTIYWELMLKGREWLAKPTSCRTSPPRTRRRQPATTARPGNTPQRGRDDHARSAAAPGARVAQDLRPRRARLRPPGGGDRHHHANPAAPRLRGARRPAALCRPPVPGVPERPDLPIGEVRPR